MTDSIAGWLRALPGWEDATVAELEGGRSNRAWRLTAGARDAVLKIDAVPRVAPLNTRAEEAAAQGLAAAERLAADVHWHSPEGILTEWLAGETVRTTDLADESLLGQVGQALRRLHALPRTGRDYDFAAWARHYRATLEQREAFNATLEPAFDLLTAFVPPGPRAFSHNDLVPANIIRGESIAFIDYEYACDNSAWFDLATLIVEGKLDARARRALTRAYFGSAEPEAEVDELIRAYRAMHALWDASSSPAIA